MEPFNINDFEQLDLDNNNILLFHPTTLQIYPLSKSNIITKVLHSIKKSGVDKTHKKYGADTCNQVINYVSKTIANGPATTYSDIGDNYNPSYDVVVLPIAGMCNLNCPYCFAQTDGGFNFPNYTKKDVEKVISYVMDSRANTNAKTTSFVFFGGEPLLKFDIIEYTVSYINNNYPNQHVEYSITTNGTIVDDNILSFFKKNNFLVLLSLDGPDNEFNLRKYHDGSKSIYTVLNNIELYKKSGIPIELRATLINTNPYIVDTFNFFENLQCPFSIVFAYQSENKSHQNLSLYDEITLQSIKKQLWDLLEYYKEKIDKKDTIYTKIIKDTKNIFDFRIGHNISCSSGRNYFTITADGNIYSCAHLMNIPRYRMGTISEGITSPQDYLPLRVTSIADCQKCWVRMMCSGGCVTQKISMGMKNTTPMTHNACELEKLKWEFYLKMYYLYRNHNK